MKSQLIAVNIPCPALEKTKTFFNSLIGIDVVRALSSDVMSYHVGMADGVFLWLTAPLYDGDTSPTLYFGVDDLSKALADVKKTGGETVYHEIAVPIDSKTMSAYAKSLVEMGVADKLTDTWGRVQMVKEPGGVTIALCEVEPHSQIFFGLGKYRNHRLSAQLHTEAQRAKTLAAML